ncbi:MAG: hypothetical protein ABFD96_17195, partial [Armatimonadia bacterium]
MTAANERPARFVLEDVPRIGFYNGDDVCPRDTPVAGALTAVLQHLGDELGYERLEAHGRAWLLDLTYTFAMGVSGAAFFLSWGEGWAGDNVAVFYMSADAEAPERKVLEAFGYGHEWVMKAEGEARQRERIIAEISERQRPVLGYGVIGPPEPSVIAGYDEDGAVLIGWSYFQDVPPFNTGVESEPEGYFRKRDWFAGTEALLVLGDKHEPPPLAETHRKALQWALQVARVPMTHPELDAPKWYRGRRNGLAAYEAWAGALQRDDDFVADDPAVLWHRYEVHNNAVGSVAEGRWYAAQFLRQMALREEGMAAELVAAAECYEAEHDLMWQAWGAVGGNGRSEAHVRKLQD